MSIEELTLRNTYLNSFALGDNYKVVITKGKSLNKVNWEDQKQFAPTHNNKRRESRSILKGSTTTKAVQETTKVQVEPKNKRNEESWNDSERRSFGRGDSERKIA